MYLYFIVFYKGSHEPTYNTWRCYPRILDTGGANRLPPINNLRRQGRDTMILCLCLPVWTEEMMVEEVDRSISSRCVQNTKISNMHTFWSPGSALLKLPIIQIFVKLVIRSPRAAPWYQKLSEMQVFAISIIFRVLICDYRSPVYLYRS